MTTDAERERGIERTEGSDAREEKAARMICEEMGGEWEGYRGLARKLLTAFDSGPPPVPPSPPPPPPPEVGG
jgi:hypothetical protein